MNAAVGNRPHQSPLERLCDTRPAAPAAMHCRDRSTQMPVGFRQNVAQRIIQVVRRQLRTGRNFAAMAGIVTDAALAVTPPPHRLLEIAVRVRERRLAFAETSFANRGARWIARSIRRWPNRCKPSIPSELPRQNPEMWCRRRCWNRRSNRRDRRNPVGDRACGRAS